jgi:hypothetical protein
MRDGFAGPDYLNAHAAAPGGGREGGLPPSR